MTYVLLLIGFALLIKGADFFVEGSSGIAKALKIPSLLIGLTIVAFGTSSPEAAVSISAALKGSSGIAIGNVMGSNIFNITFIIGLSSILFPMVVEKQTIRKEIPLTLLGGAALLVLCLDKPLSGVVPQVITRGDGMILLLLFGIFLYYIFEVVENSRESMDIETHHNTRDMKLNVLYTVGGLIGIIGGGELVVRSSVAIAKSFGLSETLIGLTIIAVGTSLPELITSIVASLKKQSDIALGNIVGSNIFNILFILGFSAVLSPIPFDPALTGELILNLVLTIILLVFSRTGHKIHRGEGYILCSFYIIYLVQLIVRNL